MENNNVNLTDEEKICQDVLEYLDDDRNWNDELLFIEFCKVILKMIDNIEFADNDEYKKICSLLQSKIFSEDLFCNKAFAIGAFYGATRILDARLYELEELRLDDERKKIINGSDRNILLELINRNNVSAKELAQITGVDLEELPFKLAVLKKYGLCICDRYFTDDLRYNASSNLKRLIADEDSDLQTDNINKKPKIHQKC